MKQTSSAPVSDLTREEYFAERGLLIDAIQRGFQRAEQMVMGGAPGALILSVTFLDKIAPAATAVRTGLLQSSWGLLIASMCFSMVGQLATAQAFTCEMRCLDAAVNGEPVPENRWATTMRTCGALAGATMALGIGLLTVFAYVNAPFNR